MIGHAAAIWKKIDGYARKFEIQFEKRGIRSPFRRDRPLKQRVSIVTPLYNVALYLDEFLASLTSQSTGLRNVEIILVDDGSTDETPTIAQGWQQRFPRAIRYVRKVNGGAASARNVGLKLATGKWITFPDPDDFLSRNYLAALSAELSHSHQQPLLMVSFKLVFFDEATGRKRNGHPLRHRYTTPRTELSSWEVGDFIQLSVATACFDRGAIEFHGLEFDERITPTFEDGHFVNRLLLAEPNRTVVFNAKATYYYRKRENLTSALDGSQKNPGWYTTQLRYGYLDLLERAVDRYQHVPRFIQTAILYDVFFRFKTLVGHEYRLSILTEEQREEFASLLHQIFSYIEQSTINAQSIGGLQDEHKVALLGLFKNSKREPSIVYIKRADIIHGDLQISNYSSKSQAIVPIVNGSTTHLYDVSVRRVTFLGEEYYTETRYWVKCRPYDTISFEVDGTPAVIKIGTSVVGTSICLVDADSQLRPSPGANASAEARRSRDSAVSLDARSKFHHCWLLMDRFDKADDNAEAFYRYLIAEKKDVNAFFVLSRKSPDWQRLAASGFRLIDFQSKEHFEALTNADFLVSSHGDKFIRQPFPQKSFGDLSRYKFVFLQHGVTKDDMSRWYNSMMPDMLVASTIGEYMSIVDPSSSYLLTKREVKLTGFARHDSLLREMQSENSGLIFVMPTWRGNLTTLSDDRLSRQPTENFLHSEYLKRWREFINSPALKRIADGHGKEIVFCPHPVFAKSAHLFSPPEWVTTVNSLEVESLRPYFTRTAVLVTDYSSVAFDVAYLDRSVVYYQFDSESFFDAHIYEPGYFDYSRDGFGPVTLNCEATINAVEASLSSSEDMGYSERRLNSFPLKDGQNCKRIYEAITSLNQPTK